MPPAAVIPDPILYIEVVAVNIIIVGLLMGVVGPTLRVGTVSSPDILGLGDSPYGIKFWGRIFPSFTVKN